MTLDLASLDYIQQLPRAGVRPTDRLMQRIVALGQGAVAPLIALATDLDALYDSPPACYGPIHALRLLGELGDASIIEPLVASYPMDPGTAQEGAPPDVWDADLPQILGRLGAALEQPAWAIVDRVEGSDMQRQVALDALSYATMLDAELRARVVAELRRRIQASESPQLAGQLLIALGNIGDAGAYADVMALYKAGRIDREIIPPATARQLLLSSSERRLGCVRHPLGERYDQHGPYPPEALTGAG